MITQPFTLPDDGWFQISAIGDFPHATTGLVQVIDADAVATIVQKFTEESAKPNFPGVLVDWDHASLDLDKPTEAAGWIMNLQQRPDGLWGQVRWSDRGAEAISGGRYRFMSPVWRQEDCLSLGEKKVRPLRLFNCALTNDPNIKGMFPLSNRARPGEAPERSRALPISNRTAVHFARGNLLANGMYHDPRTGDLLPLGNRAPMTEEQRKAMFAKMNGGGGGGGGGGGW